MLNQPVSEFELPSTGSKTFKLSAHLGKTLIIYFYPKDSTPGCTS
ncbi:MAG: redoxin domain-containing protein, partial [Methylophilaceae bacterium]|nr:redoxin domain-containing protein [Methylophilaceae bacterium]